MTSKEKGAPPALAAWKSLVAGAIAGGVEGFTTYPLEYAKTMVQLRGPALASGTAGQIQQSGNPFRVVYQTAQAKGISALYVGCSSLVVGTAAKAGVRFIAFDGIKARLVDENGRLSGARGVAAGMGAGVCESLLAVTPFETIKTALIDDGKRAQPRYSGLIHGCRSLVKERGLGGIYRGATAVTIRQGANSAVRMGSYSWLKEFMQSRQDDPSKSLGTFTTFGIGVIAGIITVYTTMPFDTVKTRMQSLNASSEYKNTLDCATKIVRLEGTKALWNGSTARLGRLMFSGGIVFTVYEKVVNIIG